MPRLHDPRSSAALDLPATPPPRSPPDALIGATIGSYRVVRRIGVGGMGAVYLAEHPIIGSRVAIKLLHAQYAADAAIVERFYNEARAVNVIRHDNILKILDLDLTTEGQPYFVMEYLEGQSLHARLKHGLPLALEELGPIALQICAALQAAHDHQIIHRDLKPDNIQLVVHDGRKNFVKVVDFGIAKLAPAPGQGGGPTQSGQVLGTPAYMSPEQASGSSTGIDGRSDVYALGVLLYQMATGELPFPRGTFNEVLAAHLHRAPPPPREVCAAVPASLEAILLRALAKRPEDRFQSMQELHDALADCLREQGLSTALPAAPRELRVATARAPSEPEARPLEAAHPALPRAPATVQMRPDGQVRAADPSAPLRTVVFARRSSLLRVAAAAVFLVALACAGWSSLHRGSPAARAASRGGPASPAAAPATSSTPRASTAKPVLAALRVESDPPGAECTARWPGGEKQGRTPLELSVPPGTRAELRLSRPGYLSSVQVVLVDGPRTVLATLAPSRAGAPVPHGPHAAAPRPGSPGSDDSTLPVRF